MLESRYALAWNGSDGYSGLALSFRIHGKATWPLAISKGGFDHAMALLRGRAQDPLCTVTGSQPY